MSHHPFTSKNFQLPNSIHHQTHRNLTYAQPPYMPTPFKTNNLLTSRLNLNNPEYRLYTFTQTLKDRN